MGGDFEFSMPRRYRNQMLLAFSLLGVAAAVVIWGLIAGNQGMPPGFAALWLAVAAWNAYWFLTRFAVRVQVVNGEFRWETPLNRGSVPLDHLQRARPSRLGSGVEVFDIQGCRAVLIFARRGMEDFLSALKARRPELETSLGWMARFTARMPARLRGGGFRSLP